MSRAPLIALVLFVSAAVSAREASVTNAGRSRVVSVHSAETQLSLPMLPCVRDTVTLAGQSEDVVVCPPVAD